MVDQVNGPGSESRSPAPGADAISRARGLRSDPPSPPHEPRRLRYRTQLFVLLALLSFGPLALSNAWGYLQSRRALVEAAQRNVRTVAELEASQVATFVAQRRAPLGRLAENGSDLAALVRALRREDAEAAPPPALEAALRSVVEARMRAGVDVEEVFVVSPDGTLRASSRRERPGGVPPSDELCARSAQRGPSVAGLDYESEPPRLVMAAPVRDASGSLAGVVCARFRFDVHRDLVVTAKMRVAGASLFLVDERGQVVCGSFEEAHAGPVGHEPHAHPVRKAAGPDPWEGRFPDEHGADVLAAYAPVPELGWGVLVEVPAAVALALLERLKWQAVVIGGAIAAIVALAVYLASSALARPLGVLAEATRRTAEGARGESVPVEGPEEVAAVGRAFNAMSRAIDESHELLERRIAERTSALRASREFVELLLHSIDRRVLVVNRHKHIVKANRAAEMLHGPSLVGLGYHDTFAPGAGACGTCPVCRTLATGRPASAERLETVRGVQDIVQVDTFPVASPGGRVEAVVEMARIVTAEKRLFARTMHEEKMAAFGLLAAGVAHEIGNPLASIQSQLRLTREYPDPERVERTLAVVDHEVERMSRLLRELVDFTRRRRDEVARISIGQVVEDVARLVSHDPRARSVIIRTELAQGLPAVRAREDELFQVLVNLALNAFDAMTDGGTLTFETAQERDRVVVRVRDTGHGLGDSAIAHLFEPFFTTKAPGKGTGLGLFVSRGIVEALGGRLELERTGPDGVTFAVRVPSSVEGNGARPS